MYELEEGMESVCGDVGVRFDVVFVCDLFLCQ